MINIEEIRKKASTWLGEEFDEPTRSEVKHMMENDEKSLINAFYQDLEFGTGGLRGIMGAGTNRMNRYTLGMATQGLSNYLKKHAANPSSIKVAIAYDCRNNSSYFAKVAADIFTANGFTAYLFESLRPTPVLSYAIRLHGCDAGVIITASHNPKEYNGYKVSWKDGGQVVSPHDRGIINEVRNIRSVKEIAAGGDPSRIVMLGEETDNKYLEEVLKLSLNPEIIRRNADMGIVYTPLHGTGYKMVPQILRMYGFNNIHSVEAQSITDGNFPTLRSPNPEDPEALAMALSLAREKNADLVMATDPDADRLGIAVRKPSGEFVLLNGNQTAALLTWYIVSQKKQKGELKGNEYFVNTIVTSDLLDRIAEQNGVKNYNVLTGFKYFAALIRDLEGKEKYIGGGEESYGYLPGDYVRDKDAVSSCALVAEVAAWAADHGKSMWELLLDIYIEYGLFREKLVNVVREGAEGAAEIKSMMEGYRTNPPASIAGSRVIRINDYLLQVSTDPATGIKTPLDLEKSNVIQFFLANGTKISVRPSGTEPKIKFYFSTSTTMKETSQFPGLWQELEDHIDAVIKDMNL
ncbi:MAG TPA: phospho-sugar mutase [Bacteroidales bacterium]|jgi:phosphoglucomutase|nr:phospho-sugar mutase [Bacteroidales bacterium]MBP7035153.1 phospho-sugar mutase [Bacteroidales bacterium]MBP8708836.1 phospho-sugar mutase [Bacteroidales bacterium]HPA68617.1 phospho-sugar mutase [Bacteroidales bacterium]HQN58024.1 phospho-sugar mutase [Bacteroidales bacterium]